MQAAAEITVGSRRSRRAMSRVRGGFTLIELIAVVVILAVLGGVATGKFFDHRERAQRKAEDATVASIRAGISQTILTNAGQVLSWRNVTINKK